MSSTAPLAQILGSFASRLRLDAVPPQVVDAARLCIADTYGVTLAGLRHDTLAAVRRVTSVHCGSAGPCSLPFTSEARHSPAATAQILGAAAHAWDYDDTSYTGIVHGSAVVWSAVAAVSQAFGLSGRSALEGFIAGVEAEYALGEALSHSLYFKGWWATGVLGPVGAAAGVARALGLDEAATAHAISIAASQAAGPRRIQGWPSKPWLCGRAAESGLVAALYASEGLTAPPDAFEHPAGFAALHNDGRLDRAVLDDVGSRWRLVQPGVACKLYPACSAAQAATEALVQLRAEYALAPDDVAMVECEVTALVDISLIFPEPQSVVEAQFSMPFAMACALRFGDLQLAHLQPAVIWSPEVRAILKKVRMIRSTGVLAGADAEREFPEGALVRVRTTAGRELERFHGNATGTPQNPMSEAQAAIKFVNCTEYAGVPSERADALWQALLGLEQERQVAALYRWE